MLTADSNICALEALFFEMRSTIAVHMLENNLHSLVAAVLNLSLNIWILNSPNSVLCDTV